MLLLPFLRGKKDGEHGRVARLTRRMDEAQPAVDDSMLRAPVSATASVALAIALAVCPLSIAAVNQARADVRLGPRPAWIGSFCKRAASVMRRPVLCPEQVPANLAPTVNTSHLVPTRAGYVLDGGGKPLHPNGLPTSHWVFIASTSPRTDNGAFVKLRRLRIRERNAQLEYFLGSGSYGDGLISFHLAITWREGGVTYRATVHDAMPGPSSSGQWTTADRAYVLRVAAANIEELRGVAAGMTFVRPAKK